MLGAGGSLAALTVCSVAVAHDGADNSKGAPGLGSTTPVEVQDIGHPLASDEEGEDDGQGPQDDDESASDDQWVAITDIPDEREGGQKFIYHRGTGLTLAVVGAGLLARGMVLRAFLKDEIATYDGPLDEGWYSHTENLQTRTNIFMATGWAAVGTGAAVGLAWPALRAEPTLTVSWSTRW